MLSASCSIWTSIENRFGQRYRETLELHIIYLNPGYISKENEIGCSAILLSAQTEEVNLSE